MNRTLLLLRKDLLLLRRSPLLLAVLVLYPLLVAGLIGLVAGYASSKPRVALVDLDDLPPRVKVAGQPFDINGILDRVADEVALVRLGPDEADRQLANGKVVAAVTVPPGFVTALQGMTRSPTLRLELTSGGLSSRVEQQVQALVYSLNRELQDAYIDANLDYVDVLLNGGSATFLGQRFDVLGLTATQRLLGQLPPEPRLDRIRSFLRTSRAALAQTDEVLRATANPIELEQERRRGRAWVLSAQVQAYALALTISLLCLLLAAGALAAERDENVIGRLARGLVRLGELVAAKIALAATVAVALGLAIAVVFGAVIEIGNVTGGQPWERLPLLAVGLALAGACLGALGALLGALAREARTASLVALLVVLPVVFLGLVPREVAPVAAWISDALPFAHAVRLFSSGLYDLSPWETLAREAAWLAGLGLVFAGLARLSARRLLT
jgi:ABC-type Na+ efflux pump permease subunit